MIDFFTDNGELLANIPNSIPDVEGEAPLLQKIAPWIASAAKWMCTEIINGDDAATAMMPQIGDLMKRAVACKAMYEAMPALDVVMTPNGFGVVSSQSVAPASAARVASLRASMLEARDAALIAIMKHPQVTIDDLALPTKNRAVCTLVTPAMLHASQDAETKGTAGYSIWDKWMQATPDLSMAEESLGEEFFSHELIDAMRADWQMRWRGEQYEQKEKAWVLNVIANAAMLMIQDKPISTRRCMEAVNCIRNNAEIFPQWHGSVTANLFKPPVFKNDKKSHGYFF